MKVRKIAVVFVTFLVFALGCVHAVSEPQGKVTTPTAKKAAVKQAYRLKVNKVPISLTVTSKKTTLCVGKKIIVNPDPYKFYDGVQYVAVTKILYIRHGGDEVEIAANVKPLKGVKIHKGKYTIIRTATIADNVYRFNYYTKDRHEIAQEVTSTKVPTMLMEAVTTFKGGK